MENNTFQLEIVRQEHSPSVMQVLCDGKHWKSIHSAIFGRNPKLSKNCLNLADFEREFNALETQLAKRCALKRLSLQAMLSNRLKEFLSLRLVSDKTIEIVLQELINEGFINDLSFAESFIRVSKARSLGPRAIAQKLAVKGLESKQAIKSLESSYEKNEQIQAICRLLKTRYASRNLKDPKDKQRTIAALCRRGFDLSLILSCF